LEIGLILCKMSDKRDRYPKYNRLGVCTMKHIFPTDKNTTPKLLKRKNGTKGKLQDKYKVHDNSELVRQIFNRFMYKVMERVANGDVFQFPGTTGANIAIKPMADDRVKELRQDGFLPDYDIAKAGFKIPGFFFDFGPRYARKDRGIYVPKDLFRMALKNAEDGVLPWTFIPKSLNHDN